MEKIDKLTHMKPGKRISLNMTDELKMKMEVADKCLVAIFMLDAVVMAQVERLTFRAMDMARQEGLFRHEVKRDMNAIKQIIDRKRSSHQGNAIECYFDVMYKWLPQCKMRFMKYGTRAEDYLLAAFVRKSGSILKKTEDEFEALCVNNGFSHPKLLATLSMIIGLCFKAIQIHAYQFGELRKIYSASEMLLTMGGELWSYVEGRITHSMVNEPMINRVMDLTTGVMKRLGIDRELVLGEVDDKNIRDSIDTMCDELGGKALMEVTDSALVTIAMEYTEFYLACLRMDMLDDGKVDERYRNTIANIIGQERVDKLLDELHGVDPIREDEDLIDLSQRLPEGEADSAIYMFRSEIMRRSQC